MKIIINKNILENNHLPQASGLSNLNEGIGDFAAGLVGGLATLLSGLFTGVGLLASFTAGVGMAGLGAFAVKFFKNASYKLSDVGRLNSTAIDAIVSQTATDAAYKSYLTAYLQKLGRSYNLYEIINTYNNTSDTATDSQKKAAKIAFFSIVGVPQLNYMLRKFYQTSGFLGGFTTGNKSLDNTFKNTISAMLAKQSNLLYIADKFNVKINLQPIGNNDNEVPNVTTPKNDANKPSPVDVPIASNENYIPIEAFKCLLVAESDMFKFGEELNEDMVGDFVKSGVNSAKQSLSNWWNRSRNIDPMGQIKSIVNAIGLRDSFKRLLNQSLLENPDDVDKIANGDMATLSSHLYGIITPQVLKYITKFVNSDGSFDEIKNGFNSLLNNQSVRDGMAKTLNAQISNFVKGNLKKKR